MKTITIRNDTYAAAQIQMIGLAETSGKPTAEVIVLLKGGYKEAYDCGSKKEAKALVRRATAAWKQAMQEWPVTTTAVS